MQRVKNFDNFLNESSNGTIYALIIHDWNPFVVPSDSLKTRPNLADYMQEETTEKISKRYNQASDNWFKHVESYYCTPEILELWGWRHGWGSETKDVFHLRMGEDFDIEKRKEITLAYKTARSLPDIVLHDAEVAIPIAS